RPRGAGRRPGPQGRRLRPRSRAAHQGPAQRRPAAVARDTRRRSGCRPRRLRQRGAAAAAAQLRRAATYEAVNYHVGALLAERARTHPDTPFLRFSDAELTFAETDEQVNAVARGLAALGVGQGDRVAILLPNCVEMVLTW